MTLAASGCSAKFVVDGIRRSRVSKAIRRPCASKPYNFMWMA